LVAFAPCRYHNTHHRPARPPMSRSLLYVQLTFISLSHHGTACHQRVLRHYVYRRRRVTPPFSDIPAFRHRRLREECRCSAARMVRCSEFCLSGEKAITPGGSVRRVRAVPARLRVRATHRLGRWCGRCARRSAPARASGGVRAACVRWHACSMKCVYARSSFVSRHMRQFRSAFINILKRYRRHGVKNRTEMLVTKRVASAPRPGEVLFSGEAVASVARRPQAQLPVQQRVSRAMRACAKSGVRARRWYSSAR